MNYSQDLLTRFKASNNGCSDYMAAKMLNCTRQQISMIKSGNQGLSDEKVIVIAKAIGEDPKKAVLRRLIERADSEELRQIYEEINEKIEH